jgi:diguanylate cyclase (GGDEF)-like protein
LFFTDRYRESLPLFAVEQQPTMSSTDRPTKTDSAIDLADRGSGLELHRTERRVQHALEHLLDAFAMFTAIRDTADRIVDFRMDHVNNAARVITGATPRPELGEGVVEMLAGPSKRELFADFCHVVETGEPLVRQSLQHHDSNHGGKRLVRAYELRAARIDDGLVVGWRDMTGPVLAEAELERRNLELTLVGELVDYLQAVESSAEVFDVAASFGSRLFGDFSGGLFSQNESGNVVESMASWGERSWCDQVFAPEDCWALRRGQRHGSLSRDASPRCAHVADDVEALLCIPFIAQGQATGLLVLSASGTATLSDTPPSSAATEALAVSVAEHIGLALTNIRIRGSLRDQSIRDPLTGLFNRRYLEETLEREISRSARSSKPIGLMMVDIDNFKQFNDRFGHSGGDALIRELGSLLESLTRVEDAACRYGGDEFVVLLPESPPDVTLLRAEEIRQAAYRLNVNHDGSILDAFTLTIGVAAYPDHGADAAGLVHAADAAMYRAKHAGGDMVGVAQRPDEQEGFRPESGGDRYDS